MSTSEVTTRSAALDPEKNQYNRRIRAWTMYDWANSAFITTVVGVILPVYYSRVAGATLPSEATATAYWSLSLSISLFVIAILSPILGTIADAIRGKKRLLAVFITQGVIATALLVLVERGDWLLASIALIIARIGFGSANVFYDALLPHIAREEDRDRVSARGYAMGYLGGGLLLAVNIAMLRLPGTWGARLSFLSVAIWWAVFSIPILTQVPEPPASGMTLSPGENMIAATFGHLWGRLKEVRRYRELFKMLIAFLLYNDGIGTIIGVGVIYGAELGFDQFQLVLSLLLMQFAGIPFALIFGRLPNKTDKRRPVFLAFIMFNLVVLPIVGLAGAHLLKTPPDSIPIILGILLGLQVVGLLFAWLLGRAWFSGLANKLDTQRSILLSLIIFMVIAIWGFAIRSAFEFWFLAWMISVVLGGSQALSRSLYASISPASKSGEFFGLFSIMEKFSAMLGPLMFAGAVWLFGSSRPGVLSLIVLFIVGAYLLMRVNVAEGQRVASLEDAGVVPGP